MSEHFLFATSEHAHILIPTGNEIVYARVPLVDSQFTPASLDHPVHIHCTIFPAHPSSGMCISSWIGHSGPAFLVPVTFLKLLVTSKIRSPNGRYHQQLERISVEESGHLAINHFSRGLLPELSQGRPQLAYTYPTEHVVGVALRVSGSLYERVSFDTEEGGTEHMLEYDIFLPSLGGWITKNVVLPGPVERMWIDELSATQIVQVDEAHLQASLFL